MKVYLLWHHEEDGPEEDLKATTDIDRVKELLQSFTDTFGDFEPYVYERLNEALSKNEVGIYYLMNGWGGLHLQVVELS